MRVLVVSNLYPPHGYGGYEWECAAVVSSLSERGHDVRVLTSSHRLPNAPDHALDHASDKVMRTIPEGPPLGAALSRWRRVDRERQAVAALDAAIGSAQPDVLCVWNIAGIPASVARRIAEIELPVVWVVGDDWPTRYVRSDPWFGPFCERPLLGRLVTALSGLPTSMPDLGTRGVWTFNSTATLMQCQANSTWTFRRPLVEYHGIDLQELRGNETPHTSETWAWRLLFVGRLDPSKGIDTLIAALELLPEANLDVAAPAERDHLSRVGRVVENLGLERRVNIRFSPHSQIAERYRAADVCVFPSEWAEPLGLVPLEAMACGTPVVATGTGGSAEYLRHGVNCLLFKPGDRDSLASAVSELASNAALRRRLVEGGVRTASEFTVTRLSDRLEELLISQ